MNISFSPRRESDYYPTPPSLVKSVIDRVSQDMELFTDRLDTTHILDAGAGDGIWGLTAKHKAEAQGLKTTLTGVELRNVDRPPEYDGWAKNMDFLKWGSFYKFSLVFSNPPFFLAQEFIEKSLFLLDGPYTSVQYRAVFLLPLSFLASQRRQKIYKRGILERVYILVQRPSFINNHKGKPATSSTEYGIYIFNKQGGFVPEIDWITWR